MKIDFMPKLVEIRVKMALVLAIVPLQICRAIGEAMHDLNGPPEDDWDSISGNGGYEELGTNFDDG